MRVFVSLAVAVLAAYLAFVYAGEAARLNEELRRWDNAVAIAQAEATKAQALAQVAEAQAKEAEARARAEAARAAMWSDLARTFTGQVPVLLLGASHGALLVLLAVLVLRRGAG
ncbi:hypothetical protein [Caldilinea sp.]|uniref:hypothetical protein n=1 Tax=Caldilinea sp. TaxID=2293560 RepID=UPI0021DD5CB9|nr:hypothetical protein [Caldilinea sp.]GIV73503.1 MAG: hypothetical protein KatS3mg049_2059 [Caldilinea sp.]